ncbi:MAG: RNA polymerase sigma factor [Planctomycetaceae bacterium]|nr:RNA polymerase sigma factor [Planctomycetaceae bacterium]
MRRHQNAIAARMWHFTRDKNQLEELVHDVFVEAYVSLKSYRGTAPFVHWLNRIATRVGYRHWKGQDRKRQTVSLEDWDAPKADQADPAAADEAAELLHKVLAQLPTRDRLVLTLMYLEELPVSEVAHRTGWSQTMVKVQAHRARGKLRALLDKMGVENL